MWGQGIRWKDHEQVSHFGILRRHRPLEESLSHSLQATELHHRAQEIPPEPPRGLRRLLHPGLPGQRSHAAALLQLLRDPGGGRKSGLRRRKFFGVRRRQSRIVPRIFVPLYSARNFQFLGGIFFQTKFFRFWIQVDILQKNPSK